ncbi:MAG: MauE/DoxX family redox-associated membrane protein [Solirubrobacteraceae bacterium]
MAVVGISLLLVRFLLCGVFLVAGVAKLADRSGSRDAFAGFGVPGSLAAPLAVVVPVAELAVALLLVPVATARWAAIGALALLAVFTAGVANALLRGREPDCHCFGQLRSEPVGASTLTRNAALALIAAFVALGHPLRGPNMAELAALGGMVLVAGVGMFAWQLLRQYGRVLLRLDALERQLAGQAPEVPLSQHGPPIGLPAPPLATADLRGEAVGLDDLLAPGLAVMLVFTDPSCGPCHALLPEVAEWQHEHRGELTIALVSRGSRADNGAAAAEHGIERMLLASDLDAVYANAAEVTPSALLLSREGAVAAPVVRGPAAIRALVSDAVEPAAAAEPGIGDPAPPLNLADLAGAPVGLPIVAGRDTFLLFWNPACGHCEHMLADLRALERDMPADAPSLLLVSTGDAQTNRAQGLASPIALDPEGTARRAFGMRGTPMGVIVDAGGRFASSVAAGGPAVLELLTPQGSLNGRQSS